MSQKIDTMRLRILQTKCMTVSEIAEAMGVSPEDVADNLNRMGYKPIYKRDVPEQHTYKTKNKEENTMSKGRKTPIEVENRISELYKQGMAVSAISKEIGVPPTTVSRLCHKFDKKEEPAPSANDTSSKDNISINSIAEIPADVNPCDEILDDDDFCCEVTGDTDMEAYLAQDCSTPTEKAVPDAVKEACLRMREDELSKIDTLLDEVKFRRRRVGELEKFLREGQK